MEVKTRTHAERARLNACRLLVFLIGILPAVAMAELGVWYILGVLACALFLARQVPALAFEQGELSRASSVIVFVNLLALTPLFTGLFPSILMSVIAAWLLPPLLVVMAGYQVVLAVKSLLLQLPYDWLLRKAFKFGERRWRRQEVEEDKRSGDDKYRDAVDRLP